MRVNDYSPCGMLRIASLLRIMYVRDNDLSYTVSELALSTLQKLRTMQDSI